MSVSSRPCAGAAFRVAGSALSQLTAMRVRVAILSALAVVLLAMSSASAGAEALTPCASTARDRTLCGRVTVALDRAGAVPGTIALRVKALPPAAGGAGAPVLAIAGGPGQAAVPLLDAFAGALRPLLRSRELVVFDQRGTGGSGRLRCSALASGRGSLSSAIERCATELGAQRTAYTTAASVEDVEAVRAALGAERLIVYAASYGTKVALAYAAAYPQHVERLVLDSIVPPEGIDPFQRSTLASIPRVLRAVCAGDCRFARDPAAELAALARRLARHGLRGTAFDGRGRPHFVRLSESHLLGLLLDGDFDRFLRAGLPAAVHSALAGDPAPLLRLAVQGGGAGSLDAGSDSDAVYVATTCEDGQVPWAPGTPLGQRRAAVDAVAGAIPASAFLPFDRATVRALGTADLCRGWPESPIVQPALPLPSTPTLILSGDDDLRTPRSDALALAGRLPGAQLLTVPDAGHGVLFSDPGDCAQRALLAFVGGLAAPACRHRASVLPALPPAPRRLQAVRRVRGVPGVRGRTVAAALLTIDDATEQLLAQLVTSGQAAPFGGLRAGSAALQRGRGLRLRGYGYVPGVRVSGLLPARGRRFTLMVRGRAAAHGWLRFSRGGVEGMLDGMPVQVGRRALGRRAATASRLGDRADAAAAAETVDDARTLWLRGRRGGGLARGGR